MLCLLQIFQQLVRSLKGLLWVALVLSQTRPPFSLAASNCSILIFAFRNSREPSTSLDLRSEICLNAVRSSFLLLSPLIFREFAPRSIFCNERPTPFSEASASLEVRSMILLREGASTVGGKLMRGWLEVMKASWIIGLELEVVCEKLAGLAMDRRDRTGCELVPRRGEDAGSSCNS